MEKLTCKNCATTFEGKYCPNCAEKVLTEKDFTLKSFLLQGIDIFTHVDSKISKSIISIFKRPGELTLNNWNGIRVAFAKPIQLFIVLNAIFYLLNSYTVNFNIFNTPLHNQITYFSYSNYAKTEVDKAVAKHNTTFEEYQKKFDLKSDNLSKSLLIIMIPIQALLLWLFFFRKKPYYVHHLIFATHLITYIILYCLLMIGITILYYLLQKFIPQLGEYLLLNDTVFSVVGIIMLSYYYFNAFKKCFNLKVFHSILMTVIFVYSFHFVLEAYRFVLFIIVKQTI